MPKKIQTWCDSSEEGEMPSRIYNLYTPFSTSEKKEAHQFFTERKVFKERFFLTLIYKYNFLN